MNLDLQLKRGASFLTCEIIDLRTDHRNLCYYLLRSSGAPGGDLLPFYRHIAPLERKSDARFPVFPFSRSSIPTILES